MFYVAPKISNVLSHSNKNIPEPNIKYRLKIAIGFSYTMSMFWASDNLELHKSFHNSKQILWTENEINTVCLDSKKSLSVLFFALFTVA